MIYLLVCTKNGISDAFSFYFYKGLVEYRLNELIINVIIDVSVFIHVLISKLNYVLRGYCFCSILRMTYHSIFRSYKET